MDVYGNSFYQISYVYFPGSWEFPPESNNIANLSGGAAYYANLPVYAETDLK